MGKGECYGIVGLESIGETLNREGVLLTGRCTLLQQLRESCWFRIRRVFFGYGPPWETTSNEGNPRPL